MKKLLIIFVMVNLFIFGAAAADFIDGFEDIPLIEGFRQLDNQGFSFGNEESGYTEVVLEAKKHKTFDDVSEFYAEILPKLGWNLKSQGKTNLIFMRDDNTLEISRQKIKPLKISISLKSEN